MARIVAVANQKGGVGKTTTSVNLSASIALQGQSVLLIDLDPQGNATSGVGIDPRSLQSTVYTCLIKQANAGDVVQSTDIKGLSVIPSNADLAGAEIELVSLDGREHYLRDTIQGIQTQYDVIILDCPPALGVLTINALAAAQSVLIPVQCEYYALEGLTRGNQHVGQPEDEAKKGPLCLLPFGWPRNAPVPVNLAGEAEKQQDGQERQ